MLRRPIILLPFFIIAFFEGLALELIYFSNRWPLSLITAPIIRKFAGEPTLHYPINLVKISKYFYYTQMAIYIIVGVFLIAITINIIKNIKSGLPLKTNALIKNALNRYVSLFIFGIIMIVLISLLKKGDALLFTKIARAISIKLPQIDPKFYSLGLALLLFLTNIIMQVFFVLTIPIIVIRKNSLFKALLSSIAMGARYFFSIFTLILLPFLIYLPIVLLKSYSSILVHTTFPEISLLAAAVGIVATVFVECFIVVCATQFLLAKEEA
jgi:hypothetical protein